MKKSKVQNPNVKSMSNDEIQNGSRPGDLFAFDIWPFGFPLKFELCHLKF